MRVLLVHPKTRWTIEGLARESEVSLGFTHAAVMSLIEQGHVHRDRSHRLMVREPVRLLQRWAAFHSYVSANEFVRFHSFERDIEGFTQEMGHIRGPRYALTALAGAHLVAPYVRPTSIHFYVEGKESARAWAGLLSLRPVESGGNVSAVIPYDVGVFYGTEKARGATVVNAVQLFVDLFNYPARGEEAAEALLRKLQETWVPGEE